MKRLSVSTRREFLALSGTAAFAAVASQYPNWARAAPAKGDLAELTTVQAALAIRNGDVKAEDYAKALLQRCEQGAALNAFISIDPEQLLEKARAADLKRQAGEPLEALHGVPLAIKDLLCTRALPTTGGTNALRNFRPKEDAPVLTRLFEQGALLLGKNNTHELGLGWTNNNEAFGPARNPYDPSRVPGGSSGGTAVAIASRMAPAGMGTDAGGSIRVPAGLCGIVGFRPTWGRYPRGGLVTTQPSFGTSGPMARSVADLVLLDAVIMGEPSSLPPADLTSVRLGVPRGYFYKDIDPAMADVVDGALRRLKDAGITLIEADMPELSELMPATYFAIAQTEARAAFTQFLQDNGTGVTFDEVKEKASPRIKASIENLFLETSKAYPSKEQYEKAVNVNRPALKSLIERYFRDHNVQALVFPPLMMPAPLIGQETEIDIGGKKIPYFVAFGRNALVGSCASLPSVVVPAGLTKNGLPIGIEFDGLNGQDRKLLALALGVERVLGQLPAPSV